MLALFLLLILYITNVGITINIMMIDSAIRIINIIINIISVINIIVYNRIINKYYCY